MMSENKLILEIPDKILSQLNNNEFYAYFKINKIARVYCIVLLNNKIEPENLKFNQKYKNGIKSEKDEYQKYTLCGHVKISKNKITFKTKLFIDKIKFLMQGKELEFYYDKEIESIVVYNQGNYEQNKEIIENN